MERNIIWGYLPVSGNVKSKAKIYKNYIESEKEQVLSDSN